MDFELCSLKSIFSISVRNVRVLGSLLDCNSQMLDFFLHSCFDCRICMCRNLVSVGIDLKISCFFISGGCIFLNTVISIHRKILSFGIDFQYVCLSIRTCCDFSYEVFMLRIAVNREHCSGKARDLFVSDHTVIVHFLLNLKFHSLRMIVDFKYFSVVFFSVDLRNFSCYNISFRSFKLYSEETFIPII